jgi:hypothetical protein
MAGRSDEMGPARLTGLMLVGCGAASVGLLAAHPGDDGPPLLAAVLRREAAQALPDALVHGGFVLVLMLELIGFAALAARSGPWRTPVIAAMVFALAGSGLLGASMILDGLVTPGLAAHYAGMPADLQEPARALLTLIGAAIRVMMPGGLRRAPSSQQQPGRHGPRRRRQQRDHQGDHPKRLQAHPDRDDRDHAAAEGDEAADSTSTRAGRQRGGPGQRGRAEEAQAARH